jgi:BolA protein
VTQAAQRPALIRERLTAALAPTLLEVIDDSHKHAGHASAGGAGHFRVNIVADAFEGKNLVQRHQLVYGAVADLIPEHIHALSIQANTPSEQKP